MKKDIENIIRANLPEKKEEYHEYPCQKCNRLGYTAEHDSPSRHGEDGECLSCPIQVQCEECQATGMIGFPDDRNQGFNQALSQINISLITDEVLKVVEKPTELLKLILPLAKGYVSSNNVGSNKEYIKEVENYLSNLSPNKK